MNAQTKKVGGICAAALAAFVAVWWFALMSPMSSKLSSAKAAKASAEGQVTNLQGQISQLKVIQAHLPADQQALLQLQQEVPDTPVMDKAIDAIQQAVDQSGVSMSSLSPGTPALAGHSAAQSASTGTPSITVGLTVSGSYGQITSFLTDLASMPRTVVVTSLSISGTDPGLSAQIGTQIFYAGQPSP